MCRLSGDIRQWQQPFHHIHGFDRNALFQTRHSTARIIGAMKTKLPHGDRLRCGLGYPAIALPQCKSARRHPEREYDGQRLETPGTTYKKRLSRLIAIGCLTEHINNNLPA